MLLLNYVLSFIQNFDILIHCLIRTWSTLAQACAVLMLWSAIPFLPASPSDRHILSSDEGSGGRWGMMAKSFPTPAPVSLCALWWHPEFSLPSQHSQWQMGTGTACLDPEGALCAHSYNCCCFKMSARPSWALPTRQTLIIRIWERDVYGIRKGLDKLH